MDHQEKAFLRRTRKGKIVKIVNEKYLRSDAAAGSLYGNLLSKQSLRDLVALAPHKQLIIIDTNIALHQIDVLDHKCPATSLVIILQTVLQELRHLNLAVYRRLSELLKDETRSYIFYPNEVSVSTAILR
jgi:exosome complex exonuclease DIS3/RRP44